MKHLHTVPKMLVKILDALPIWLVQAMHVRIELLYYYIAP
jgi:hypothetical protein